jgi:hypothetical protein
MARAVGVQCTGSSAPSVISPSGEERSAGCTNGTSNSQAPVTQYSVSGSAGLQGNMQNISDRLQTLHELYENRNQVNYVSCWENGNPHTFWRLSIILVFILNGVLEIRLCLCPKVKSPLSWAHSSVAVSRGGTGSIDWTQLSRLFTREQRQSPISETSFQIKIKIVDNK